MTDYISREAAIHCCTFGRTALGLISELRRIPAAGVAPVVHARWITCNRHEHYPSGKEYEEDYCSACGKRGSLEYDYCPHCWAIMDGGEKDEHTD